MTPDARSRSRSRSLVEARLSDDLSNKKLFNIKSSDDLAMSSTFFMDEIKTRDTISEREKERETTATATTIPTTLGPDKWQEKKKSIPIIEDEDLTLVEISDMRIAEELMCNRHIRPPLPIGIPNGIMVTRIRSHLSSRLA